MLPFGWRRLSLVVLPLDKARRRLLSHKKAFRKGHTGLAKWLLEADGRWKKHRKSREDLLSYLNWQSKITTQTPLGPYKLLYNTSGTHLCACVVDTKAIVKEPIYDLHVQGFIADTKTYWLEAEAGDEAYYLAAILNAPSVDKFIKPFQTKGSFGAQSGKGERDIHRRPFEVLPIPKYDPSDDRHRALAALSRACHEKVAAFVSALDEKTLSQRVGALRQRVRKYLDEELKAIEALVGKILPLCPASSPDVKEA